MCLTVLKVYRTSGPSGCLLKDPDTERTKVGGVFTTHLHYFVLVNFFYYVHILLLLLRKKTS